MSAYDPTRDSPELTAAWLRYKNLPIRHRGGLHGIFKSGWDAARALSAPVQVSREDLAQLLNSHQLWGRLVADPDDWEDYASDDVRAAHLKTADAILTLLGRETAQDDAPTQPEKVRIYMNTNIKVSRGKYAAHAVHAALTAFGVHPGTPVVVLGAKPRDIENMRISIHDAGKTELEPGTLTAGTNWPQPDSQNESDYR